jgi:beta-glucosidase
VKNTGKVAGDEVVQLYIHPVKSGVPWPPKELRGFARTSLKPGEKRVVTIPLPASELAFYHTATHSFLTEPGSYEVMVGSSSRDIRGTTQVRLEAPTK